MLSTSNLLYAQFFNQTSEFLKANSHWALGRGQGLDFSSGAAARWQTSVVGREGHSAVSDRQTGKLLFYTNGGSVWNANNQVMPNGAGLMGNSMANQYTTWQGTLIVPFINDNNKYYVFSLAPGQLDSNTQTGIKGSLFYNVVDMSLDNNKGDVVQKNIVLDTLPLNEALIAVPGCDNDIWIITFSSNATAPQFYKTWHITADGVNHAPVMSQSRLKGAGGGWHSAILTISPDRKKIVITHTRDYASELSEFDVSNGTISNSFLIPGTAGEPYGGVFSPDNSKLYIGYFDDWYMGGDNLTQYDISQFDSTVIRASAQVVAPWITPFGVRLYNDTIYFQSYGTRNINRVNQPNQPGTACDVQLNVLTVDSADYIGLGSDVVFAIPSDSIISVFDTIVYAGNEQDIVLKAFDTAFAAYRWSTGDTTVSIKSTGEGSYWVEYKECNKYYVDSFIIKVCDPYTTINVDEFVLGTTGGPFATYQWYFNGEPIPGATNSTLTVSENGDYEVEITDEYGCIFRSDVYEVTNVSINDINFVAASISVYPNPVSDNVYIYSPIAIDILLTGLDGRLLLSRNDAQSFSVRELPSGLYLLRIQDKDGRLLRLEKIIKE